MNIRLFWISISQKLWTVSGTLWRFQVSWGGTKKWHTNTADYRLVWEMHHYLLSKLWSLFHFLTLLSSETKFVSLLWQKATYRETRTAFLHYPPSFLCVLAASWQFHASSLWQPATLRACYLQWKTKHQPPKASKVKLSWYHVVEKRYNLKLKIISLHYYANAIENKQKGIRKQYIHQTTC